MIKDTPLFSIVVACKNEERSIKATIKSIIEQSYDDFEIVIVDGKSSDKTVGIIEKMQQRDQRIKLFSDHDNGVFDAMNRGIKESSGKYIQFVNAKDRLADKNVLQDVSEQIISDEPDIVIGDYIRDTYETGTVVRCRLDDSFREGLRYHWGVCHQAVIAKKETLSKGFQLDYKFAADYDWFCRQYIANRKILKVDRILTIYDGYGMSSMLYNKQKLDVECRTIACKYFDDAQKKWEVLRCEIENKVESGNIQILRAQYNLLNDLFSMTQQGYDFSQWFRKNELSNIGIYGMHHLGRRLYDTLSNTGVHISFVTDKKDLSEIYEQYVSADNSVLPQADCTIITSISGFYEIKENLESKISNICHKILPIERLVAEFKYDLYGEGKTC